MGFKTGPGVAGLLGHAGHEWVTLANLLGLLLGFALLADHFDRSRLPDVLPHVLPDDWKGPFVLLVGVRDVVLPRQHRGRDDRRHHGRRAVSPPLHIGYLAAIVAASNAGGAGSVVGDTTTTMMWIAGARPLIVLEAYVAAAVAVLMFGISPHASSMLTRRS